MSQKTKTHKMTRERNARLRCRIQYIAADRCNDKIFNTAGEIFEHSVFCGAYFEKKLRLYKTTVADSVDIVEQTQVAFHVIQLSFFPRHVQVLVGGTRRIRVIPHYYNCQRRDKMISIPHLTVPSSFLHGTRARGR